MRRRRREVAVVLVALVLLAAAARWSLLATRRATACAQTEEAFAAGDWAGVVSLSGPVLSEADPGDGSVLRAMELRCEALLKLARGDECAALLGERLARPDAASWLPRAGLAEAWVNYALAHGQASEAAVVAERLRAEEPRDVARARLAFRALRASEDLDASASFALGWIDSLPPDRRLALLLDVADAQARARQPGRVLATLGAAPTTGTLEERDAWWSLRISALAQLGDAVGAAAAAESWSATPDDAPTARANLAVALSEASVAHPRGTWWDHLAASEAEIARVRGKGLKARVYRRLVGHLTVQGRLDDAAVVASRAQLLDPSWVTNADELRRMSEGDGNAGGVGELVFRVEGAAPPGAAIWVSPEGVATPQGAWTPLVAGNETRLSRAVATVATRWVLRSETSTYASGVAWPQARETTVVSIRPGAGKPRAERAPLAPAAPGDGSRRVLVVILDSGDWRLSSYLRQRGEMPVLDALLTQGWRAAPVQYPAFTAAAMAALTSPAARTSASFPAAVHQLGVELAGLASIGKNPFAPVGFVLPAAPDIFSALGVGDRRVANLLFSHGAVSAGRHAEVVGPAGARTTARLGPAERELTASELRLVPEWSGKGLETSGISAHVRSTAAQVDGVAELVRSGGADVVLYRLEALDLVTHGGFAEVNRPQQDDGMGKLYSFYRYVDLRLGELAGSLDGDDLLVVMSDHGALTSMEHDPIAMFVAWGNGVPRGRTGGRVRLMSVARFLAALEGVPVDWPGEEIAPWTGAWRARRTPPGVGVPWAGETEGG